MDCLLYVCKSVDTLECAYHGTCIVVIGELKLCLFLHHMKPGDETQVRFGSRNLSSLSHLTAQDVIVKMDTSFFTKRKEQILEPDCEREHAHM